MFYKKTISENFENAAVDNLKREIRLLEERQKQWKIEIKTMEEQIKLTINSLDLTTEERDNFYVNEIQKGEKRETLENGENILIN